jgi:hypothetical protein
VCFCVRLTEQRHLLSAQLPVRSHFPSHTKLHPLPLKPSPAAASEQPDFDAWYSILGGSSYAELFMPNGTRCKRQLKINSPKMNSLLQFSTLPQGGYSPEDLLAVGQARTALAYTMKDDRYNLTFFEREDGKVGGGGDRGGVCVVCVSVCCPGYDLMTLTVSEKTHGQIPADPHRHYIGEGMVFLPTWGLFVHCADQ